MGKIRLSVKCTEFVKHDIAGLLHFPNLINTSKVKDANRDKNEIKFNACQRKYEGRDKNKDWKEKLEISNVVQLNNLWDIATHNTPYD